MGLPRGLFPHKGNRHTVLFPVGGDGSQYGGGPFKAKREKLAYELKINQQEKESG